MGMNRTWFYHLIMNSGIPTHGDGPGVTPTGVSKCLRIPHFGACVQARLYTCIIIYVLSCVSINTQSFIAARFGIKHVTASMFAFWSRERILVPWYPNGSMWVCIVRTFISPRFRVYISVALFSLDFQSPSQDQLW